MDTILITAIILFFTGHPIIALIILILSGKLGFEIKTKGK